ncbi:MAG: class I SAM-dependent methyltransferase [Candidatus Dormibacteria bacterium]
MGDRGEDYQARVDQIVASGASMHGEADLVASLSPARVLDAGCGTGRVGLELARRGIEVVGVDADPEMLGVARRLAPQLDWRLGDLSSTALPAAAFDVIVMAGNVMIFLQAGTEAAVLSNLAPALAPGGSLVAGFQLGRRGWGVVDYDAWATGAGLVLAERWASWDREPWREGADYSVSVHRRDSGASGSPGR